MAEQILVPVTLTKYWGPNVTADAFGSTTCYANDLYYPYGEADPRIPIPSATIHKFFQRSMVVSSKIKMEPLQIYSEATNNVHIIPTMYGVHVGPRDDPNTADYTVGSYQNDIRHGANVMSLAQMHDNDQFRTLGWKKNQITPRRGSRPTPGPTITKSWNAKKWFGFSKSDKIKTQDGLVLTNDPATGKINGPETQASWGGWGYTTFAGCSYNGLAQDKRFPVYTPWIRGQIPGQNPGIRNFKLTMTMMVLLWDRCEEIALAAVDDDGQDEAGQDHTGGDEL